MGLAAQLRVLVVNAGSTSLKLHVVDGATSHEVDSLEQDIDAVAHRVVHGGSRFRAPTLIDDEVHEAIRALEPLAPLHNAPALRAIDEARAALPDAPHVAVFDTEFHATIPEVAATYAIPRAWREWGIRRYGFHGLSAQWAAEQVPARRLAVCHLGGGCSVTGVLDGRSVDTTMGFSPLEGVPMTTRSGSLDPGALLYLLRERGLDAETLDRRLNFDSGFAALGGAEGMAELQALGTAGANLAIDVFTYRVSAAVAAMSVACGGLDALVFTAGIGENSARVREDVCMRLAFLGVELDAERNISASPDCEISAGRVSVHVIRAREELVAAAAAQVVLGS